MTREEILAMEAEELSQKVAEEIMGECYHQHWDGNEDSIYCLKCGESRFYHQKSQEYSTNISSAWQVVDRLVGTAHHYTKVQGLMFDLKKVYVNTLWEASFEGRVAQGKTAPEAICKAALITKIEKEEK